MKYNNTVIKVKNPEHGAKVVKWWKDQGVNTKNYVGNYDGRYYGIIDNNFVCYTLAQVQSANATIIELPNELPQRGDEILVWNTFENNAQTRIFVTYIEGHIYPVFTVEKGMEEDFKNKKTFGSSMWRNWKPIPKEDIVEELVELTVEDISNGKGVGVKPNMNSYKLIKEYPGSPTIGTIAKEDKIDYVYYYLEKDSHTGIGSSIIENNPEFWKKVEKLFTTEDGIDIYKGDTYWFLRKNYEPFIPTIDVAKDINPNFPQIQKHLGFITFSTREKAEEYVYFNKPRFSFKDMEKAVMNTEIISNKKFTIDLIYTSLEKYCL